MVCELFVSESLAFPAFVHDGSREGRVDAISEFMDQSMGENDQVVAWLLQGYEKGEIDNIEDVLSIMAGEEVWLA